MINVGVEAFFEPIGILDSLSSEYKAEMSNGQLAFLCGLIKKYRPGKIVEVGVAAGGTTAVVLNCLSILNLETDMFSMDLSVEYYRDRTKETGFLIKEFKKMMGKNIKHELYTGKIAAEYIETIGREIDFLILDTVHRLPGEMLDFLACYPFLKKGAIVVLHDIAGNYCCSSCQAFATKLLFDTVVAEKYVQSLNNQYLSNIGAFKITEDTDKYIDDVFSALTITWSYMPKEDELILYKELYKRYYPNEKIKLFDVAVQLNQGIFNKNNQARKDLSVKLLKEVFEWGRTVKDKRLYIYGCGDYGKRLYRLLEQVEENALAGYIVSDGQEKTMTKVNVYYLSEMDLEKDRDVVFVGVGTLLQGEVCARLHEKGVYNYIIPSDELFGMI